MKTNPPIAAYRRLRELGLAVLALLAVGIGFTPLYAATVTPVSGEIQRISLNNPSDHWSGGVIVVGGQNVIIPRNLLIDLPANRLTLKQIFDQAPATCVAAGETGLAKGDACNASGMGGIASISANRNSHGNIIAGDVLIEKGVELVTGVVTYIDYDNGYFRMNGNPGDSATGVMVRINDPDSRHTVQRGPGCAGGPNCSADPRFTLDADNYTNVFSTGFPLCIPSTVLRTVTTGLPPLAGVPGLIAGTVAMALPDGTGDALCPATNRTVNGGQPVDDSRRFAPIMLGDNMTAEGNFEKIGGVRFLSAHSTAVGKALSTKNLTGQPDYLFLEEVGIDAPAFQNQRARALFIGFATRADPVSQGADVKIWSIHNDPQTNSPHEFPLASVIGCDLAAGAGTCGAQGLVGAGNLIFKIVYDIDFVVGAKARLNPCAHLRADPFFAPLNLCPNGGAAQTNTTEMLAVLSPIPHEIQARTGHELAHPGMISIDINGALATHGQYLFPFGINLGGITVPEMVEINLDALGTPIFFSGIPWNLDRRLSPGGCNGPCDLTPQPLDPFPWEDADPRFQTPNMPTGNLTDANYTASTLVDVRNRMRSFVDGSLNRINGNGFESPASGNFNGSSSLLALPTADSPAQAISVTPEAILMCTDTTFNIPPVAVSDSASTGSGVAVTIPVLANDSDANGNPLSIVDVSAASGGVAVAAGVGVIFTPTPGFSGVASFTYTISDGTATASALVSVTVAPPETLATSLAEFRTATSNWNVAGTSTAIGATITVHVGSVLGPVVLGSSTVTAGGTWTLNLINSSIRPDASRTISIESTGGASRLSIPLVVRR
ncbi:MAG: Ig-like domain-containing protein [Thiobacillaceae bacterium]